MKRLTKKIDNGRFVTTDAEARSYGETDPEDGFFYNYFTGEAVDKLAAYEDTGLEPADIEELPPHGDLIDRDALKHKFCTHCDGYEHDTGACVDGDQDCMDAKIIMTASVIVPSNKEEGE